MTAPRVNAVVEASKILDLRGDSARGAVEAAVQNLSEFLAVWPAALMTPAFVADLRTTAVDHLIAVGVEDGIDLVEGAIVTAIERRAREEARGELLAQREKDIEARASRGGAERIRALSALAATMRRGEASEQVIYAALVAENRFNDPPLLPAELSEIARTVALYRPGEVPRTRKIETEVKQALKGEAPPPPEMNFRVDRLVFMDSDPPRLWLTMTTSGGKVGEYPWTMDDLASVTKFRLRFAKVVGLIPTGLPKPGDSWDELVNVWLTAKEIVSQPPDASPTVFMRELLRQQLERIQIGDGLLDLQSGTGYRHHDQVAIVLATALDLARQKEPRIQSDEIASHLRTIGYEHKQIRVRLQPPETGSKPVWVWLAPVPAPVEPGPPDEDEVAHGNGSGGNGGSVPLAAGPAESAQSAESTSGYAHAHDDVPTPTDDDIDVPL